MRFFVFFLSLLLSSTVSAWVPLSNGLNTRIRSSQCEKPLKASLQPSQQRTNADSGSVEPNGDDDDDSLSNNNIQTRRNALRTAATTMMMTTLPIIIAQQQEPQVANALVKGVAPPTKLKPTSDRPKCTNVEECQAMAERKQQEEINENRGLPPPKVTSGGVKYIDIVDVGDDDAATVVKAGDDVTMYYKVLKLGKRSYDGLSGEGTVVFSRGYGLEDDEKKPGDKVFITTVGGSNNIIALNEALVGMKVGGTRRFAILPQKGWEKATKQCDGGPGGQGSGGSIKTDYVIVPTATMVATEDCLDKFKQPFPTTYAQERRMAQRFDQSLIMEIEVIKAGPSELS